MAPRLAAIATIAALTAAVAIGGCGGDEEQQRGATTTVPTKTSEGFTRPTGTVEQSPELRACLERVAKRLAKKPEEKAIPAASECVRRHGDLELPEKPEGTAPENVLDPEYISCISSAAEEPDKPSQSKAIEACGRKFAAK